MKKISNYIHQKMVVNMLQDDSFIPIYTNEELVEFVYRKVEE